MCSSDLPILDLLHRFAVEKNATNAQISLAWMLSLIHIYSSIRNDGCELSANNLIYRDGRYSIDFDDLEAKVADPKAKILGRLICGK